ncbi:MAG: putative DNA binding domain-containing protein [Lentisphaerae bacterium]|nr:putative DNA binding domain-containing protein [Lentisphaerota bacterium]
MIPDSIRKQLREGKSSTVEFLAGAKDFAPIGRAVCAFLNGKGGDIFCGVSDGGEIVGVPDASGMADRLRKHLQAAITPHAPLLSVTVDDGDDRSIITIEIPAGTQGPYVYEGAAYVRHGAATQAAEAATLQRLLQAASVATELWEKRVSTALEYGDLDTGELEALMKEAAKASRFVFEKPDDRLDVLRQLGLTRGGQFTQAADVLLARNPALRHPQIRVRATCFEEDKEADRFIDDKVFEGPLVQMLERAEKFILRNMRTVVSFRGKGLQTDDRAEYPPEAIREGLVNAMAHRDYASFHGGVAVRLYPSRLEIWNVGHLPSPLKPGDLKRNHPSIPVNPDIVHALYIRGYMNRIGRGTQKIVNLCREHGLKSPSWRDDSTGVTLTLFAQAGGQGYTGSLNPRQKALLAKINPGEEIRPGEYQRQYAEGVTDRQARRDLTELEDANLLERVGAGATTRYRRTERDRKGRNRT